MGKAGYILLIFYMLFFSTCGSVNGKETGTSKNVLILYALSPSTPAYLAISEGIRTKLTEAFGNTYSIHSEYLETERYPHNEYPQERFDIYNEKYRSIELNLLICIGIDIVTTVKEHASSQIIDLPAITVDFNFTECDYPIETRLNDKTTEIQFTVNAWKSISLALDLFPGTESVYFIGGTAKSDRLIYTQAIKASEKLGTGIATHFLNNISMDDVLHTVNQLPGKSIIIVPSFTIDTKQVTYFNPEAIRLISKDANAPVFTLTSMGFGEGALGGYILSYEKVGLLAGETAGKILKGADPHSFTFNEEDFYEWVFDARQLERWGLTGSKVIPEGSEIRFEEVSFFGKFRLFIFAGILFVIFQTIMIISLVRLYKKQKNVTKQLIVSEGRFRELVREDRILHLSQLMASLSHELSQPLTAMLSTAQAGIRFIDSNNADPTMLKDILQNIVEDDKRTAAILSSIRSMMKFEKRDKEKVDLNKLIEEITNIYFTEAKIKNIRLEVRLADQPVYVLADAIQIQQVLLNLLNNSAQSIEKINAKNRHILISLTLKDGFAIVSVRDHGEGIADGMIDQLFKPFITSRKEGLGIGLAISRRIIDDHQGKIWAEHKPGGGALVLFSLKLYKDEQSIL